MLTIEETILSNLHFEDLKKKNRKTGDQRADSGCPLVCNCLAAELGSSNSGPVLNPAHVFPPSLIGYHGNGPGPGAPSLDLSLYSQKMCDLKQIQMTLAD